MRKFIFCILSFSALFAINNDDVKNWDSVGQYNRVCSDMVRELFIAQQDESIANLYAKACLKMDKVNSLIIPMVMLYKDKASRENAALYSTILFQKKMLYLALVDGFDISNIRTPKVNYILSNVFDEFVKGNFKKDGDKFIFNIDDKKTELLIRDEENIKKMVILIYDAKGKIESIKMYW